ncbi:MAG: metallophosphoesterase [Endomicrobium sp.]|jgi:predicted MPP superfamily phosphohydrolase|nr:metallophosphoesterase [Endomicrobium sp.]
MGFFFRFSSILLLLASYYLSQRIKYGLSLKRKPAIITAIIIFSLTLVTVTGRFLRQYETSAFAQWLNFAGYCWAGIFVIAVTVFILNDILILCNIAFKIKRFKFYSTLTALAAAIILSAAGIINALPAFTAVKQVYFQNPALPAEKFTITLLSDIHINKTVSARTIQNLVNKANSLNSDIIVIAGDFTDTDISNTYKKFAVDKFSAPYGVFAVMGNHDYSPGFGSFLKVCEMSGITVLQNESAIIDGRLNLAGVSDRRARRTGREGPNLEKALANVQEGLPVVLLSHQPEIFDEAAGKIFLQLSGHTHAGQTIPGNIIRKLFFKYFCGLYAENGSYLYISAGTRYWGPPLRLFSRNEIVQIIIEK